MIRTVIGVIRDRMHTARNEMARYEIWAREDGWDEQLLSAWMQWRARAAENYQLLELFKRKPLGAPSSIRLPEYPPATPPGYTPPPGAPGDSP